MFTNRNKFPFASLYQFFAVSLHAYTYKYGNIRIIQQTEERNA